jgi:hypothetical protein
VNNKDNKLIYEAYSDEDAEVFKDYNDVEIATGEILGDYGLYEYNLRPASTVDAGVEEIKQIVDRYLRAVELGIVKDPKSRDQVYNDLDKMNAEADDADLPLEMIQRLKGMLLAARADMTWEEYTDKHAGELAKGNEEDFGPYQAAKNMAKTLKDQKDLEKLGKSTADIFRNRKKGTPPEIVGLSRNREQQQAIMQDWDDTIDMDWHDQWDLVSLSELPEFDEEDERLDEVFDAFLAIEYYVPAYNDTKIGRIFFEIDVPNRGLTIYEQENDDTQVRLVPMPKQDVLNWWKQRA